MTRQNKVILGAVAAIIVLLIACSNLRYYSSATLIGLLWPTLLLAVLGFMAYKALPYVTNSRPGQAKPAIRDTLSRAFAKNYTVRVQKTLQMLPDWPIRPVLIDTAQQLFALKFAAQRAQEEGVPASFLTRIQGNIERAADGTWEIASKIDAVAHQGISYALIEPKLQIEAQKLQQLVGSLKKSQEGIALLTLSDTHHDSLQSAEFDLQALTQAVKLLEQSAL